MRKKLFSLLTLFVIAFLIVGCGYGGNSNPSTGSDDSAESKDGPSQQNEDGKFEPAVEITTARPVGSDYTFINGEDIHNNVHNTWAEEELGIKINDVWETADNEAYHTQIRLSLTSNEQLPDAFIIQDEILIDDLIQSGQVMDIQEAFDQYASDRIKDLYEENSVALNQVMDDGRLMGLPIFTDGDGTSPVLWIRQDWLDNLGLDAPETLDDFEAVMDAFTNDDPDGNGKDDTIGFSFSAREGFNNWMSDVGFIFGAFTGKFLPGNYQVDDTDGRLKYGSVQPGIKDALEKLNDWYEKGYLDQELAVLDPSKATEAFIQGRSGMIAGPSWMGSWPLGEIESLDPDAELRAYELPVGPDGKSARFMNSLNEGKVMLFSNEFEHMDAFFYYLDKIYDYTFGTGDFEYGFFEGYDYAIVDDEPIYDSTKFPEPHDGASVSKYNLFWNEPRIPYQISKDSDYVYKGNEPETAGQIRISVEKEEIIRAGALNYQMRDLNQANEYLGPPTETMKSKGENLETMELETFAKIIYGELSPDYYDTFVEEYFEKGGQEIEDEINEWFDNLE